MSQADSAPTAPPGATDVDAETDPRLKRSLIVAFAVVVGAWALVALRPAIDEPQTAELVLDMVAGVLAIAVGALTLARFRWIGDATALWIGSALLALGVPRMTYGVVLPLVRPDLATEQLVGIMRFGGRSVALVALVVALVTPPVGARAQVRRLLGLVGGTILVVAAAAFALEPGVLVEPDLTAASVAQFAVSSVLSATWFALGTVYLWTGMRRPQPLVAWFGLSFLILGTAQVVGLPATLFEGLSPLSSAQLRIGGFACAFVGVVSETRRLYESQRRLLHRATLDAQRLEARVRSEREVHEEHVHEARNALHVLDAAVRTIERHSAALGQADRSRLEQAAQSGLDRLQRLFGDSQHASARSAFALTSAVEPVVSVHREQGTPIDVRGSGDSIVVIGNAAQTAQIVDNLVTNAVRHASGSPITVRVDRDEVSGVLRVEDQGPGIPAEERSRIFERGYRGSSASGPGSGIGLHVCARLAREQGGTIRVEDRPGGGASFVLTLPLKDPDTTGSPAASSS